MDKPHGAIFRWPVRVYYEDTDAGGVVYHARYLNFCERARTEWLRSRGWEQDVLRDEHQLVFVVARASLEYRRPARFNDLLNVTCEAARLRAAAIDFTQRVEQSADSTVLCGVSVRVVCVDARTFRPKPIPEPILESFA
ncbi:tol-pal system-associated acyl-CoA thioesterase [Guyparkeria sp.]|uniref:tol-pal system-associated acyl-CoA thioesterase n=1 Tax=Guyparkeria sp. TaxID=2035736 RepID=UPI003970EB62